MFPRKQSVSICVYLWFTFPLFIEPLPKLDVETASSKYGIQEKGILCHEWPRIFTNSWSKWPIGALAFEDGRAAAIAHDELAAVFFGHQE